MKPLPPYAKTAKVVSGQIWVRCGASVWEWMAERPGSGEIGFPAAKPAADYCWDFVDGLAVYVIGGDAPFDRVEELWAELLSAGAIDVTVIDSRLPRHYAEADWAGMMRLVREGDAIRVG